MVESTLAEKLVALMMRERGEDFVFNKHLLDNMKPTRLQLTEEPGNEDVIRMAIMSNEILSGELVDKLSGK